MAPKSTHSTVLQFDTRQMCFLRSAIQGESIEAVDFQERLGAWHVEDGSLQEALNDFVAGHNLKDDQVYLVVPRHEATARILTLPSEDPVEIASMVALSAEEFVPYAASELLIDQCIIEQQGNGESVVLAVLVHQDVINGYLKLLESAGISPIQIFFSTACLASACAAAKPPGAEDRYGVAHISPSAIEVVVMEGKKLRYTRGVATHHDWNVPDAEEAREELAIEVRSSLSAYRRESEDGLGANQVFFSSQGMKLDALCELVAHEVGKDCFVAGNGVKLVSAGAEKLPAPLLTALGALLSVAGSAPWTVRLLPQRLSRIQDLHVLKAHLSRVGVTALVILLAGLALFIQMVFQRRALIGELEAQAATLRPSASDVSAKQDQMRIVAQQVSREGSVLELLATLVSAAPDSGMNITRFSFDRGSGINFWGRAKTKDHVFRYLDQLRERGTGPLEILQRAHSVYEQEAQERNEPIFNYQIEIPFEDLEAENDAGSLAPTTE
ncbi:MAG: pilus assembly protein PilM [Candidatus Hydrogenedentes bacterium]|nr:pilus assembly protein PilM [Candidatus Hydrogenedentota bacterium]